MKREETSSTDNHQEDNSARAPAAGEAAEAQPEFEIDIFRDWCKSCGICAAFCPRQCLSLDAEGAPVVQDSRRCTGCRWCELHCPDFAICVRELISEKPAESKEE